MKNRSVTPPSVQPRSGTDQPGEVRSAALDWVVSSGTVDRVFEQVEAKLRRRRRRRLGVAAGLLVLLAAGAVWQSRPVAPGHPASVAAVVSLPAKQVLPDGSIVELRDGARIAVAFDAALRRVVLQQGEAHFQVAKNPQRPFVVVAGGVEVRAVGTAFSVRLGSRAVEVLVTEGRVAVGKAVAVPEAGNPAAPHHYASVAAGHRVVVELAVPPATAPVLSVSPAELDERLAWRVPRLEFSGTPLAQVIKLFNQHASVRLVLADPSLAGLELSGVVRADNTESLLRLLGAEFGIAAERHTDEIVLRRR